MSHSTSGHSFGEQLEAIGIAYGSSSSILKFVKTEEGRKLGGIELTEYRSPSEQEEQFIGSDEYGRRICFDVEYNSSGVETVEILGGQSEKEFGTPEVVVLEQGH